MKKKTHHTVRAFAQLVNTFGETVGKRIPVEFAWRDDSTFALTNATNMNFGKFKQNGTVLGIRITKQDGSYFKDIPLATAPVFIGNGETLQSSPGSTSIKFLQT